MWGWYHTLRWCQRISHQMSSWISNLWGCDFADVGCCMKVAHQDFMEENQQQHLLTAALLNLKLSRDTIAEKDHQLVGKDRQLAAKDKQVLELQYCYRQRFLNLVKVGIDHLRGGTKYCHEFTLDKVSQWKHWFSKLFYSHCNGYSLRLSVKKERPSGFLFYSVTLSNMMVAGTLQRRMWPPTKLAGQSRSLWTPASRSTEHLQWSYKYFMNRDRVNSLNYD